MNKVSAQWFKNIFMTGVILFMGYITYTGVLRALPGNVVAAVLSIFLFDGGAYAGFQMYTGNAEGAHQRHAARVILWIDFVLAGFMVAGGLTLLPPHSILFVMLVSAVFNVGVLYYYETHTPEVIEHSQEQDEADSLKLAATRNRRKLHREAMRIADGNITRQAPALGNLLSLRATAQLKYDMRLPMTADETAAWNEDIIDAEMVTPALPAPAPLTFGFWDLMKSFFTRGQPTPLPVTPSLQEELQDSPAPIPEETKAMYAPGTEFIDGTKNPPQDQPPTP